MKKTTDPVCCIFPPAVPALLLILSGLPVSTLRATDADGDGIPADWESFRGTSDSDPSDALADFDGDGLDTRAEYLTQGRPWGNYSFHSLLWTDLPGDLSSSSIASVESVAGTGLTLEQSECFWIMV